MRKGDNRRDTEPEQGEKDMPAHHQHWLCTLCPLSPCLLPRSLFASSPPPLSPCVWFSVSHPLCPALKRRTCTAQTSAPSRERGACRQSLSLLASGPRARFFPRWPFFSMVHQHRWLGAEALCVPAASNNKFQGRSCLSDAFSAMAHISRDQLLTGVTCFFANTGTQAALLEPAWTNTLDIDISPPCEHVLEPPASPELPQTVVRGSAIT
jgi:hypothetical protein